MEKQFDLFGNEVIQKQTTEVEKIEMFSKHDIADAAFKMFRELGFPYPSLTMPEMMAQMNELVNLPLDKCLRSTLGYRVADTYNKHRFHASAIGTISPVDGFLDDVKLKKVIRIHLQNDTEVKHTFMGFMSMVNGVQACSNFRPAYAKLMYNTYAPVGGKVLDTSTGYGGRLVGFLASHCVEYHGVDPNTLTYAANKQLAADLAKQKKVILYNSPIEDTDLSAIRGTIDVMFTSPPYFVKEQYSTEDTQSCVRYKAYNEWCLGFLRPMLQKCFESLKKDAHCIVNIHDVSVDKVLFPLIDDTIYLGKKIGLTHLRNDVFAMNVRVSSKGGKKTVTPPAKEVVIIFKK